MKRQYHTAASNETTTTNSGEHDDHRYEVRHNVGGFVVVTKHYYLDNAEVEAERVGGEVVTRW